MADKIAVVWTRIGPQPVKMGTLVVTDKESRFTYEPHYTKTGLRGLGLVYPAEQFTTTISRSRDEYFDLLPPLQSLLPPRSERNFQRALIQKYLASINLHPKPGFDTDWEILIRCGHGAIGHLDVFADDEAALQWYATPSRKGLVEISDGFGFSLKEFMTWFDEDAQTLIDILGPTPSVGGAIPKLPLSIPATHTSFKPTPLPRDCKVLKRASSADFKRDKATSPTLERLASNFWLMPSTLAISSA